MPNGGAGRGLLRLRGVRGDQPGVPQLQAPLLPHLQLGRHPQVGQENGGDPAEDPPPPRGVHPAPPAQRPDQGEPGPPAGLPLQRGRRIGEELDVAQVRAETRHRQRAAHLRGDQGFPLPHSHDPILGWSQQERLD